MDGTWFLQLRAKGYTDEQIANEMNMTATSSSTSTQSRKGKLPVRRGKERESHSSNTPDVGPCKEGPYNTVILVDVYAGTNSPPLWLWVPASDSNGLAIANRIASLALIHYESHYIKDFRSAPPKTLEDLIRALRREWPNPPDCQFDDAWVKIKLKGIMKNQRLEWVN